MSKDFLNDSLTLASYVAHARTSPVTQPERSIERWTVLSHISDSSTFPAETKRRSYSQCPSASPASTKSQRMLLQEHSVNTSDIRLAGSRLFQRLRDYCICAVLFQWDNHSLYKACHDRGTNFGLADCSQIFIVIFPQRILIAFTYLTRSLLTFYRPGVSTKILPTSAASSLSTSQPG